VTVLSTRALNRALLDRQLLTERSGQTAEAAITHLVGLQAQAVNPPYIGLWTRLATFAVEDLERLLTERRVVRVALMRSTIHLVTAPDCLALRPLWAESLARTVKGQFGRQVQGVDLAELVKEARDFVEEEPLTFAALGKRLALRRPDADPNALAQTVRNLLPLAQLPPRGLWSNSSPALHTTATHWLGQEPGASSLTDVVIRYLNAFGPASILDAQKWSGLTKLKPAFTALGDRLRPYRDESGTVLFDLSENPPPTEEVDVPVRFLPEFDNILLSHADRSRIMTEADRLLVFTSNGIIRSTILVDGFVAGRWRVDRTRAGATLVVEPFRALGSTTRQQLLDEGERLVRFVAADAADHEVRFEPV
jgi:hypothetical protein